MEGSITQLNLSNYLINKKEKAINYFQHQYQNYKNFVKDTRRLNLSGNTNFGKISTYKLSFNAKYGDYISDLVLEVELPDISNVTSSTNKKIGYCNNVGFALIEKAELYISGNKVDTQTSEWMDIWTSLTVPFGIENIFNQSVKKFIDDIEFALDAEPENLDDFKPMFAKITNNCQSCHQVYRMK